MLRAARHSSHLLFSSSSSSSSSSSADAVVIGGGVLGASTAYHLAKRGIRPVLVERHK